MNVDCTAGLCPDAFGIVFGKEGFNCPDGWMGFVVQIGRTRREIFDGDFALFYLQQHISLMYSNFIATVYMLHHRIEIAN